MIVDWVFDPIPPSGAVQGGTPSAHVFDPDLDSFVLNSWYALDGTARPTARAIGDELHMTVETVRATRRACLEYLRSEQGRAKLEKAIWDTASEIE